MKKLKILAMIPAVILCACNADQTGCQCSNAYDIEIKGDVKKVTLAEAEDQIKEIKGHNALNEYTDIEIVHIMNSGKGENKQIIKMKFALKRNTTTGEAYFRQEGILSYGQPSDRYCEGYLVDDGKGVMREWIKYREKKSDPFKTYMHEEGHGENSVSFSTEYARCYMSISEIFQTVNKVDEFTKGYDGAFSELYSNGSDYFKYYHGYGEDGKVPEEDSESQYYLRYTGQYKNGQLAKWDATWRTTYGNESCGQVIVKYDKNIDLEVPESFKKDYVVG